MTSWWNKFDTQINSTHEFITIILYNNITKTTFKIVPARETPQRKRNKTSGKTEIICAFTQCKCHIIGSIITMLQGQQHATSEHWIPLNLNILELICNVLRHPNDDLEHMRLRNTNGYWSHKNCSDQRVKTKYKNQCLQENCSTL